MIAEIGSALAAAKGLREISDRIKDAEVKNLLADLQIALAEIKVKCADLEKENLRLKRDLTKVKQVEVDRENMEFQDGGVLFQGTTRWQTEGTVLPAVF